MCGILVLIMAEQEIRALREYAESLEKQNVALNG